jgi:metal-responsive CopG/Arc/MetJ family transcriptional regulator
MASSKVVSITLPPAVLKATEQMARKENRTFSELIGEALRCYQRQRAWDGINAYGRARAAVLGLTQKDVVPVIKQFRKERRERGKSPAA